MTILVLDVGSSSVRALLFDRELRPISGVLTRRAHQFSDAATADPLHLRGLVEACIDEILEHPAAQAISAVGMATFVGNLLAVDSQSQPITPIYTYADTSSAADAAALAQTFDQTAVHARTGCRIHPAYHPAKFAHLRRTSPALFDHAARWMDFATFCYATWFGRDVPCSYSVASWSGLLNREALTWDAEWLAALGLNADDLPLLADFTAGQVGLSEAYASRWPMLRAVPFYLAVGDGAAANLGCGGHAPDRPVLTVGTTAALRIVTQSPPADVPLGLWAYRVDATRHLIGGATSEGGNIFAWATRTLRLDPSALERDLLARTPGDHVLTVLPLLAGERSPNFHPDAAGTLHGLRLGTTPLDITHALLEGVALRLRLIFDLLGRPGDFLLAGGGSLTQSPAWTQIIADAVGVPLHVLDTAESTALGVVRLIAEHHGMNQETHDAAISHIVRPRLEYSSLYRSLLEQQAELYRALYG